MTKAETIVRALDAFERSLDEMEALAGKQHG